MELYLFCIKPSIWSHGDIIWQMLRNNCWKFNRNKLIFKLSPSQPEESIDLQQGKRYSVWTSSVFGKNFNYIWLKMNFFLFQKTYHKMSSAKRPFRPGLSMLTHWGRVTHICVGEITIIGSDNGLSPGRCQAIIWTNAGILLIGT